MAGFFDAKPKFSTLDASSLTPKPRGQRGFVAQILSMDENED
jgi:hypothetical protein